MPPEYVNIPVSDSDRRALLVERPAGWEYYLLASTMIARMRKFEPQYRDYQLRFVHTVGSAVAKYDLADVISERLAILTALMYHFNRIFSPEIQELACGAPGEAGDPELIVHLGTRIVDGYGALLRWSEEVRGLRFPDGAEHLRTLLSRIVGDPLGAYRDWVSEFAQSLNKLPELMAKDEPVELLMTLHLTVRESYGTEIGEELARILDKHDNDDN